MSSSIGEALAAAADEMQGRRFAAAADRYRRVIQTDSQNALAYQGLARALSGLGDTERMFESIQHALQLDPNLPLAHAMLGTYYLRRNELAAARTELERAVELDPQLGVAHTNLGLVYYRAGQYAAAERALRRAVDIAPESAVVYHNLVPLFMKQRRYAEAVEASRAAFRLGPTPARAYALLAAYSWQDRALGWILIGLLALGLILVGMGGVSPATCSVGAAVTAMVLAGYGLRRAKRGPRER